MKTLTITDVRGIPADSGFLIDDGETAILCDTGFAFTGETVVQKVRKALGNRPLDYILLTHSHYDHVLGSVYVRESYPDAKVVAGEYACRIFAKPSARSVMRELDQKAAKLWGICEYEDRSDGLSVDIPVKDGDVLNCGSMIFHVVALPGHTKCSVGYYLPRHRLLLGTETLGVRFDDSTCLPSCLVGCQMTLQSIRRAKALQADRLLIPHYGVVADVQGYLEKIHQVTLETIRTVRSLFNQGKTRQEILEYLTNTLYTPTVQPVYPVDAFLLNTGIMIDLIKKEYK